MYTLVCVLTAKDDESIPLIKAKLIEAAQIYRKDEGTVDWLVMQELDSTGSPRTFRIVERFEQESSQEAHLSNPYWKTFDPYILPLLDGPIQLSRHDELV